VAAKSKSASTSCHIHIHARAIVTNCHPPHPHSRLMESIFLLLSTHTTLYLILNESCSVQCARPSRTEYSWQPNLNPHPYQRIGSAQGPSPPPPHTHIQTIPLLFTLCFTSISILLQCARQSQIEYSWQPYPNPHPYPYQRIGSAQGRSSPPPQTMNDFCFWSRFF